jgi:hypothetical protein
LCRPRWIVLSALRMPTFEAQADRARTAETKLRSMPAGRTCRMFSAWGRAWMLLAVVLVLAPATCTMTHGERVQRHRMAAQGHNHVRSEREVHQKRKACAASASSTATCTAAGIDPDNCVMRCVKPTHCMCHSNACTRKYHPCRPACSWQVEQEVGTCA